MMLRIVAMVFLAACAGAASADKTVEQFGIGFDLYKRADGEALSCQGVPADLICGTTQLGNESVFSDCSDDEFDCIISVRDVLAVPKAGLALGQEYSVFGARLKVEQCFIDRDTCELALISSRCADEKRCACIESGNATTSFYFSRDRGVTAFYTVPDNVASFGVDAKLLADSLPLLTYVLVGKKGFLGEPLALRRQRSRPGCNE